MGDELFYQRCLGTVNENRKDVEVGFFDRGCSRIDIVIDSAGYSVFASFLPPFCCFCRTDELDFFTVAINARLELATNELDELFMTFVLGMKRSHFGSERLLYAI
jgi:hypothetical protein